MYFPRLDQISASTLCLCLLDNLFWEKLTTSPRYAQEPLRRPELKEEWRPLELKVKVSQGKDQIKGVAICQMLHSLIVLQPSLRENRIIRRQKDRGKKMKLSFRY